MLQRFADIDKDLMRCSISAVANLFGLIGSIKFIKNSSIVKPKNQEDNSSQFLTLSYLIQFSQVFILSISFIFGFISYFKPSRSSLSQFMIIMGCENIEYLIVSLISLGLLLYSRQNIQKEKIEEEESSQADQKDNLDENSEEDPITKIDFNINTIGMTFIFFILVFGTEFAFFLIQKLH